MRHRGISRWRELDRDRRVAETLQQRRERARMATQLEKSLRQAGSGKATVSVYRETRLHAENAGQASTAEERQATVCTACNATLRAQARPTSCPAYH